MAMITIRIDEKLKAKAAKSLKSSGINMSQAIHSFLRQVIDEKGMPFETFQYSPQAKLIRKKWDAELAELKSAKRFSSAKELHDHILKEE
jgi:addiction module RelB/DinJ family antitoxin